VAYIVKERTPPEPWHEFKKHSPLRWIPPLLFLDYLFDHCAYWLSRWAFLEVLEYIGNFSILVAVILFFAESDQRLKQKHYEAWQVINTAAGKPGSGGRFDALRDLYEDHVPLVGVDVSQAYLVGINLDGADLRRANFSGADMRRASLRGAGLQDADMDSTNLRSADLRDVDLTGERPTEGAILSNTDLTGADLSGAILTGTDFEKSTLTGVNLANVKDWQTINITNADVDHLVGAPPGFVEWAIAHGAHNPAATQP
jgi:hypothetical protein